MADTCDVIAVDDRVSAAVCDYARFVGLYVDASLVLTLTPEVAIALARQLRCAAIEHHSMNRPSR